MKKVFSDQAWEDYLYWQAHDPATIEPINALIKSCERTPFVGIGKPEPLKGDLKGWWSRRISLQDRLVYRVTGEGAAQAMVIAQLRFHY